MTLLELVIIAHRCRSTHHYIAFDALQLLKGPNAGDWKNLLLRHHDKLLKGAKAPDTTFKDFQNHVLHVQEGEWGGARDAAMLWYGKAVDALRHQKWGDGAYALGVLTHYYADPIQPFHTAQSEEEGAIHRALEWSIAKSRDTIKAMIDARGYPTVYAGTETGFVADMVLAGAQYSNPHYQTFIDHYDIDRGVEDPPSGLDARLLDVLADLIAYATSGVALLFERAFAEAAMAPPKVDLDLPGYLAALDIPIRRITKRMSDARERKLVEKMYEELQETGKVIKTLPADDKTIRALHAEQVLRVPLHKLDTQPIRGLGRKHVVQDEHVKPVRYELRMVPVAIEDEEEAAPQPVSAIKPDPVVFEPEPEPEPAQDETFDQHVENIAEAANRLEETLPEPVVEASALEPAAEPETVAEEPAPPVEATKPAEPETPQAEAAEPETSRLSLEAPVVDAPSIGPKTAARLEKINIVTIGDLLSADPEATATALDVRYIKAETLTDWQDQTRLMVEAPGLRVLDSQILVGAGIRSVEDLAKASAKSVLKAATSFLDTPQGARVLWGGENTVDQDEVSHWIDLARKAKS